jgi:hypothetical protein
MRPLLLVHGIGSNARETFGTPGRVFSRSAPGGMFEFLVQSGYTPGHDLFWFNYHTFRTIPESAGCLRSKIVKVLGVTGSESLDIITFSLGGIVAKYYSVSSIYQREIGRLIMIAPPFLGSPWANWFRFQFAPSRKDQLFPGDGRALSLQVLRMGNPFLTQLAETPFPEAMETTIIALKALVPINDRTPAASSARWLTAWVGDGDLVVPVASTRVATDHYFEVSDDFSLRAIHKQLPYHPEIQALIKKQLELVPQHGETSLETGNDVVSGSARLGELQ